MHAVLQIILNTTAFYAKYLKQYHLFINFLNPGFKPIQEGFDKDFMSGIHH